MNMHKNTRLTPSLDLDILNGIMRQAVLKQLQTYLGADAVIETHITRDMLERSHRNAHHPRYARTRRKNPPLQRLERRV